MLRRTKTEAMETRAALLDAAESVFYEKGVSRTTLTDIANAAKLTRGAIYWHFSDKAALFDAMQERGQLPQEFFTRPSEPGDDPLAHLRQIGIDALTYLGSNERSKRVCTIMLLRCEFVGEMGEVLNRMRDADDRMKLFIRSAFEEAADKGVLAARWTPEAATMTYCCAMTGLITEWLRTDSRFDLVAMGRSLIDALFLDFTRQQAEPVERETFGLGRPCPEADRQPVA